MRVANAEDERILKSPGSWPMYPYIPLKRKHPNHMETWPELGFVSAEEPLKIIGHGIYGVDDLPGKNVAEKISKVEKVYKYDTLDDLLNDGWYVD